MLYLILGIIIGILLSNLVLLLYSRSESVVTRYINKTIQNKETVQFIEPISNEEIINNIMSDEQEN